ncbi:alkaline phosphatase family protein [Brachybacterium muris]|uniref:alkaline phosphatase family protein n=1 Tax=Brachybacterium muris TaxID=219301 RepID=UPI00223B6F43|nr:alkaline phosphatase family protein [Brachybacterium muris]MCT2295603.1 alkaline phosphatase family protein [Brachybacterium muris]
MPQELAPDLLPPPFSGGARPGLLDVLAPLAAETRTGRDLVVLVDGLGWGLLKQHRALTPTLRALAGETTKVRTVFPSTTATAMVSLHTGLAPLRHGVLGLMTRDPATGRAVHELIGHPGVDPGAWMPEPTVVQSGGRRAVQVGPRRHAGSHLSGMAYRGWEFQGHGRDDRIAVTLRALRRAGPDGLVHLHLDDVDHAGHHHGIDSDQWREALIEVDSVLGTLLRRLPAGTRVHVTADHGMVDTDPSHVVELGDHPALERLIASVAGEPRALALTAVPGDDAAGELAAGLRELLGERAVVLERPALLASGLLGPVGAEVPARVAGRLPEVMVIARGRWTVDLLSRRPEGTKRLIGVHGSLTDAESWVPVVRTTT